MHGRTCAQIPAGQAMLNRFTCHHCLLAERGAEGEPMLPVIENALSTMLVELTTGRTNTAVGYERFARLSATYVRNQLENGLTKVLAPEDSLASFKGFLTWMVLDQGRALEFATVIRQAAGFFKGTEKGTVFRQFEVGLE